MKTSKLLFSAIAMPTMLLTACSNTDDSFSQDSETLTQIRISAGYDKGISSKTSYTESGSNITATWDAGDELYVVYNGKVNTLTLTEGAGTSTATFEGSIIGTPTSNSVLICYVKDAKNPSAVTVSNTGEYTYANGTLLSQDGTLEGAAKRNLYYGTTTYGTGEDLSCTFSVNTSMMKFTVYAPDDVNAGDEATLTYKSGDTEVSKAAFTVGANGKNTIYLTIPAGQYTGAQTLVYKSEENEGVETLSATKATFKAGETYSRESFFGSSVIYVATTSDWSSVISAFNAEETPNPLLILECDITTSITITRANGEIELNGHTVTGIYAQNNIPDETLVIKNGTVTKGIDGKAGQGTYYYGTVVLENVDCGTIWNDGHKYVINSGTYETIEMTGVSPYPSIVNIYGGYFNSIYRNIGTASAILYGGKYRTLPQDSQCASGYSVKANTDADSGTYPYIVSAD